MPFRCIRKSLEQALVAFGNEDCQRSGYGIYESLYEMGAFPLVPPGAH